MLKAKKYTACGANGTFFKKDNCYLVAAVGNLLKIRGFRKAKIIAVFRFVSGNFFPAKCFRCQTYQVSLPRCRCTRPTCRG